MYLIDTSVSSETAKPQPNEPVLNWMRIQPRQRLFMSVVTVGEHRQGIERLDPSRRQEFLNRWLAELIGEFAGRIVPVDAQVADTWGRLAAANSRVGRAIGMADTLIAATAAVHELTVVTHNVRDFLRMGVPVLNPWEPT